MLIVLDTNILVSALITPFGNASRVLDLVLRGDLRLLYDDRVVFEYREVLIRPKFGFKTSDVDILIGFLEAEGMRITPPTINEPLVDKDDIPFLEVAICGQADVLITGNKRHFKTKTAKGLAVMTPGEFLEIRGKMR